MEKILKHLLILMIGGSIYYTFELLFRGFSHWSMFVLGGICFLFFKLQGDMTGWQDPLWVQVVRSVIFVTCMEFITGMIVNKWCGLAVWDYSDQPLQVFGQICAPFTIIFSGLTAMGIIVTAYLGHWLYGEKKPKFHVL